MYRIDRTAGSGGGFAGNTGFRRQFLFELIVHVEHIAGTHDIAFADFNRGRMTHRPGRFGGGAALYPFTARKGDFIDGHGMILLGGWGRLKGGQTPLRDL